MTTLAELNSLPSDAVRALLLRCLSVPRWADDVIAGRPYAAVPDLLAAARQAAAHLDDAELESALGAHPRIGERPTGARHDAEHSRREQAGVDPADTAMADQLAAGNAAYERRFGRVFLVRAAGRTASELLAELDRRLGNDEVSERAETVTALGEIAVLRLEQAVS
ncbi:MAG: uraD [Humibacillus sp.]|nr:uraD [Humibacillus sp.]